MILCISKQWHPRLHGTGGPVQRHGVRLVGRLVQLRLHALQAAQGPLPLPPAQDQRQARDRPDDPHHGKYHSVIGGVDTNLE